MSNRLTIEQTSGNPPKLPDTELGSLAELYARVFADDPWNEYTTCPTSGAFFGTETIPNDNCPETECNASLQLAYPLEQTKDYITRELTQPDAALLLLRDQEQNGKLVGFSWGFSYNNPDALATAKYKTPAMQVAVSGLLRQLDLGTNGLWYLSESGIENNSQYRGKGLSREFHLRRLQIAHKLGLDAIQRTSAYGNMYRTSKRTMVQIMGTETVPDPATNALQPTGAIINNLEDCETKGRVLFARKI